MFKYNNIQTPFINLNYLKKYVYLLSVKFHKSISLLGFILLFVILLQCLSGIMIAMSLVNDSMLIPISRNTEDMGSIYTDDFFWIHERGVDFIFILLMLHFLRKFFLKSYNFNQEISWKSGVFLFLLFHGVTFMGLVLCCTHLSNVTLSIASGILHTFTLKKTKIYWILFTDKTLNTDTIIRLMYMHYILAFYMVYISILHAIDMHYDWKSNNFYDNLDQQINWVDSCLKNEIKIVIFFLTLFYFISLLLFHENEALSYEIFMWGDLGFINDVRFYGVSPHWYFRSYMGWLILCPHHYWGIFGLIFFMVILFYQPNIKYTKNNYNFFFFKKYFLVNIELSIFYKIYYSVFILSILYTASCLPFGRFYNRLGGNSALMYSYMIIFFILIKDIKHN